jgi:hypothetical protein
LHNKETEASKPRAYLHRKASISVRTADAPAS